MLDSPTLLLLQTRMLFVGGLPSFPSVFASRRPTVANIQGEQRDRAVTVLPSPSLSSTPTTISNTGIMQKLPLSKKFTVSRESNLKTTGKRIQTSRCLKTSVSDVTRIEKPTLV